MSWHAILLILLTLAAAAQTDRATRGRSAKAAVTKSGADRGTREAAAAAEAEIKKLEQRWLEAVVARDQATVADILAPEFKDTRIDGKIYNREQALAAVLDTTRPNLTRFFGRLEVSVYEGKFAVAHGLTVM